MSAKKSQNNTSIITSNITSLKINSNESKYLNNEVDDKVQKIQESSKQQGDDDEDLSDLANGGWEDDFTDNEDDVESRKEWETLDAVERNGLEKNIKDSENNKNNKIKDVQTFSDEIDPFAKNIKQLLPIPQSNIENRKKRLSENDNEIGVGIPSQKTKKPKDDKLGNKKSP
ncbi:11570_t:CDS:2 [Rhizophagus irregularis]|nr:11570_t:CDS:2 [Rhizophagus irregularis]